MGKWVQDRVFETDGGGSIRPRLSGRTDKAWPCLGDLGWEEGLGVLNSKNPLTFKTVD